MSTSNSCCSCLVRLAGSAASKLSSCDYRFAFGVVTVALAVRVLHVLDDRGSLLFETGGIDSDSYMRMGAAFASGRWPDEKPFFWAPGYSYFLGVIHPLASTPLSIRLAQGLIGAISCGLTFVLALQLFHNNRVALGAGLATAGYGPLVYFDGQISPGSLDVFLQLMSLVLLIRAIRNRNRTWLVCAGVTFGLSAVTRGGILLALPFLLTLVLKAEWHRQVALTRRFKAAAIAGSCFLAPVALVVAPIAAHNARYDMQIPHKRSSSLTTTSTRGSLVSTNVGINLYLGNRWDLQPALDVRHPECFTVYHKYNDEPYEYGASSASGHSEYLVRKTRAYIGERPLDWAKAMGNKSLQLLNGFERSRNSDIYAARTENRILSALLWSYGVSFPSGLLIPLGLVGVFLSRPTWRSHAPVVVLLATQTAFVLAFFVTARYRLPMLPILAIYASYCTHALWHRRHQVRPRTWAALFALLVISNQAVETMPSRRSAFEYVHVGRVRAELGNNAGAREAFLKALEVSPDDPSASFSIADHYRQRGQPILALAHFAAGLKKSPGDAPARVQLGELYWYAGQPSRAIAEFRGALAARPRYEKALRALCETHRVLGRVDTRCEPRETRSRHEL